jgi:transketolase
MTDPSINTIDIRDAFFDALYEIAKQDRDVVFLTADAGAWSLNRFRSDFPGRFINMGIAEQNMVSVAAGLSLSGKKIFIYAIAPFVTQRCFEQIKIDLCAMGLPVTIVGAGPGLTYASDGPTHHAIEDVSVMRALPEMTIFSPCDQYGAAASAILSYKSDGPVYVRIDKGKLPVRYNNTTRFNQGAISLLEGADVLIISTGIMIQRALDIADKIKEHGIQMGVIDLFRIKPLNEEFLEAEIKKYKSIITLEEHTLIGGIGSAISELMHDKGIILPLKRVGIPDQYCKKYGSREWMQQYLGIDSLDEIEKILISTIDDGYEIKSEEFPHSLNCNDFAEIFGVPEKELPAGCRQVILDTDFRFRIAVGAEREKCLLRAHKALYNDLKVSGEHRKQDWEKGWRENFNEYVQNDYDSNSLIPKFVKLKEYIRFQGNYIFPVNSNFETAFVAILRNFLFEKYFKTFDVICEFGCGTGHNLIHLAKLWPEKKLFGLDWAESACELIDIIVKTKKLNLKSKKFDMFYPEWDKTLGPETAVFTVGAMEQLGTSYSNFVDFLISKEIGICVNVETIYEMYDQNSLFDLVAAKYLEKRNYLRGFYGHLKKMESKNKVRILEVRRTFGSFYHDGYSYIVWQPIPQS